MAKKTAKDKPVTLYDKKSIYEKEVDPLIKEAMRICVVNDIPFMFSCAIKNTKTKTTYAGEFWLTGTAGITLADDRFERHLAVMNGFETYWPGYKETFDAAQAKFTGLNAKDLVPESYETPIEDLSPVDTGEDE